MSLLGKEKDLYNEVWASISTYGDHAPGENYVDTFAEIVKAHGDDPVGTSVLDAGCGSGKSSVALDDLGFDVEMCDLTDAGLIPEAARLPFVSVCLWNDLSDVVRQNGRFWADKKVYYVYCCDVMEHIPEQFTMLVVHQMLRVAKRGVFLSVSLVPDAYGVWVGGPLHRTVQSFVWWRDSLREIGNVTDARDLINSALFFVEPK